MIQTYRLQDTQRSYKIFKFDKSVNVDDDDENREWNELAKYYDTNIIAELYAETNNQLHSNDTNETLFEVIHEK